jgi:ribosomal-protein-alanine N-acetyltransferase
MNAPDIIRTERLELIPATPDMLRAELLGPTALAGQVRARVPAGWPPDLYDEAATRWTLDWLVAHPDQAGWSFYYFALADGASPENRVLVGVGGYKGGPGDDGTVEIGYSVLAEYRRRGIASEAVRAFITRAFSDPRVRRVIAETLPHLEPSIGVLAKCGFAFSGDGSEPGVIRFTLDRLG